MSTHDPPEQFSLVTRAESTCVERSFRALLGGARGGRAASVRGGGREPPRRTF